MKIQVEFANGGAWPKEVWLITATLIFWATEWTIMSIECYGEGWIDLGRFPLWAISPKHREEIEKALSKETGSPHP